MVVPAYRRQSVRAAGGQQPRGGGCSSLPPRVSTASVTRHVFPCREPSGSAGAPRVPRGCSSRRGSSRLDVPRSSLLNATRALASGRRCSEAQRRPSIRRVRSESPPCIRAHPPTACCCPSRRLCLPRLLRSRRVVLWVAKSVDGDPVRFPLPRLAENVGQPCSSRGLSCRVVPQQVYRQTVRPAVPDARQGCRDPQEEPPTASCPACYNAAPGLFLCLSAIPALLACYGISTGARCFASP